MKEKDIIISMNDSQKFLKKIGVLETFINGNSLEPNKLFNKIALNKASKYEEIFLSGLEHQYYNIILNDYSFFQFSFSEQEDRKNKHLTPSARYAFYPNPLENIDDSFVEIHGWYIKGEIDFEEYSQILSEAIPLNKKSPVRYDLSFKQFRKIYHPAAHFHFGISENSRIASDKVFTPFMFTKFIASMYYINEWEYASNSDFILEKNYSTLIKKSEKIKDYNTEKNSYLCNLQDQMICIR